MKNNIILYESDGDGLKINVHLSTQIRFGFHNSNLRNFSKLQSS